ncbi:MAG: DNA-directed RNA polymerase subunit beta', partial [Firmicutes bacterium]|nr:DNA-directed RNA polymerase subunit beta' [Bacillota bacterium]
LEDVIKEHPVLLNRAPTLHRLGIQAYEPVLVEGRAIKIHPLACTPYNADFDGDQMAVHVPLSAEAQSEARVLMLSTQNILNPKDGRPVVTPTQDMVLGSYYLTLEVGEEAAKSLPGEGMIIADLQEAEMAYASGDLDLHAHITMRFDGERRQSTFGRFLYNELLPKELRFLDKTVDRKLLAVLVAEIFRIYGNEVTAQVLDRIKETGFHFATKAGITISVADIHIPEKKKEILRDAEEQVLTVTKQYRRGLITADERYERVIGIWTKARELVTQALMENLDHANSVYMMATSGARGNIQQISQLAGMRGLMADPSGRIIERPIRANFREGLTVLEYFTSTHGARKGLADTALRTADSGYLTRRLVDVAQDVIVRELDCGTSLGQVVSEIKDSGQVIEKLEDRIIGRVAAEAVRHPETGEIIVDRNDLITEDDANAIIGAGIKEVPIRSVQTCQSRFGVCVTCYGSDLARGGVVEVGEAVGIIAAQSIGEPGTQLTMRTFHTGGVAGEDITQGLPRVEELFEARKPKGEAKIAEISGVVHFGENKNQREITIVSDEGVAAQPIAIPYGSRVKVQEGAHVQQGQELTEGSINPHDLLRVLGLAGVQAYLLHEVQRVYRVQGVDINDKHIEIMVRQMMRKVRIEEAGDSDLLPGTLVDRFDFEEHNMDILEHGGVPAVASPMVLGITKASLATDSFLSAASFQETTRVLTEASIKAKKDPLLGLKENVIIGKLVPAGTGMSRYRNVALEGLPQSEEVEEQPIVH